MMQSALDPKGLDAVLIANLWWVMLALGVLVMAGALALLTVAVLRTGSEEGRPSMSARQKGILILAGGVALPVVAIGALVLSSLLIVQESAMGQSDADLTIAVEGRQWWWHVTYFDETGSQIATTANEIHIPVEQTVRIRLTSKDVIHSFWVPNLQGKTDLIPGRENTVTLRALEPGTFRGQCAEFCGVQHALMGFLVIAESEPDFRAWLENQSREAAEPEPDTRAARGQTVFVSAGCAGCHTIKGTRAIGTAGPDLTHLASRRTLAAATVPNTRGYLGGWIADPQHLKPGNKMVSSPLPPDDFQALLRYLESLD